MNKKYILTSFLYLIYCVATAQIMLPAYQGVFSKNAISSSGPGNALDFIGNNDFVDCGTNPKLNITSSITVELWIKPNRDMGVYGWDRLVHRDWPTGYFFGGKHGSTNALAVVLSGDLSAAVTPINTVVVGVWQHIAFVFDDPANSISVYKDGTLISTSNWAGSISGNPNSQLTLSQYGESFMGAMDDVRIWSVARTQSEIQANMNNELNGTETGLVAYYPFNQGIAGGDNTAISIVTDKTANALNGTLTNFSKNGASSNFVIGKLTGSSVEQQTVQIGTQTWMTKNASVETYQNGDVIPEVTDAATWNSLTTGAWCYYANSSANGTVYGKLYNWYAVHDPRNMAPVGWHVPTDAEYASMQTYLGGSSIAGGKLMSTGTSLWTASNTGSTNSSGFSGLPGGYRLPSGGFNSGGDWAVFWASDENGGNPFDWQLRSNSTAFNHYPDSKTFGFSVRFIKDAPVYSGNIPSNGLVLNLDASNSASYPGSGTTWTDLSPSGNHMTLFNGASFDANNRSSIHFDGINDYVGRNSVINTGQNFTVSVWMYAEALGSTRRALVANSYNYSGLNGWFFCADPGGTSNSFFLSIGSDSRYTSTSSNTLTTNSWNYLTAVVTNGGQTIDLYKNGQLVTTFSAVSLGAGTNTYTHPYFSIGYRDPTGTPDQFTGNIGITEIYNRSLSASEILNNFNINKAKYGL